MAGSAGVANHDRLDVLALDRTGRLVVAELKRDKAPDTVTMQALNYAAMVSRFTVDTLTEAYVAHRNVADFGPDQALEELREWAPELADETLGPPGIVLVAGGFGAQVTNTAMFLYENGLDIRLVRVQLYRTSGAETLLTVSQVLPVPDAEEFMIRPRSAPATQAGIRATQKKKAGIIPRLIANDALADGAELTLTVPEKVGQDRDRINAWLDAAPARRGAIWHPEPGSPIEWPVGGTAYHPNDLVTLVIREATGAEPRAGVWGVGWLRDVNGVPLHKLADTLPDHP
ncbi:hypothetical protein [Embleya hyalina]|uniref:DUF91 domain-containing protein n=1 Tax=Embleya hyalina TaxID=516124 RepID=A0A401Z581_9ACTN|nr:hypothetical protein [Embleya hyalina]GCE01988.1 hypothetical protein EHYA_09763 [Embleya hyalina]